MPIEIKELHIRLTVNAPDAAPPATNGDRGHGKNREAGADRQSIVAECVEQVIQIIQEKQQR